MVTVGDPGNAADTTVMNNGTTGYGSVPYVYRIGEYDVTVGQYCQFLNAVAKTTPSVSTIVTWPRSVPPRPVPTIGISQNGTSGNYSYSIAGGDPQVPTVRSSMSLGATPPASATGCKTASRSMRRTARRGAGSTETGPTGQRRAISNDADDGGNPQHGGRLSSRPRTNGTRRHTRRRRHKRRLFHLSHRDNSAPINTLPDTGKHANFSILARGTATTPIRRIFDAGGGVFGVAGAVRHV